MEIPRDWFEHRREDGELLGWITPAGEDFIPIDLLGRSAASTDWIRAEEYLEDLGIGYLADIYAYEVNPGEWVQVRLLEVSSRGITIKEDDFGDATANLPRYSLPFPPNGRLLPVTQAPGEVYSTRNPRVS